jgi:HSP20 family protein
MGAMSRWRPPGMRSLRRDVEDTVDQFDTPRSFREELSRLMGEDLSPRSMWNEMDRLMDDFMSPPSLRRQLSRIFEDMSSMGMGMMGREMFVPQLDVNERENEYLLRVDLPGVKEQDVDVRVDGNGVLTISGQRRQEETRRERGFEHVERSFGSFSRSIELPRGAETHRIETDFRNGVLEVRIPKNESARARQIPVGGGQRALREGGQREGMQREAGQREGTPREAGQREGTQAGQREGNRAEEPRGLSPTGNGGGENRENRDNRREGQGPRR